MPPILAFRAVIYFSLALSFMHAPRAMGGVKQALDSLTPDELFRHVRVLASDEFEGRAPGTPGEDKTVNYLVNQFKSLGLAPGNPDGTYIQDVPLVGFTAQPTISFTARGQTLDFHFPNDSVIWSRHFVPEVRVDDSPVIFVGYGVVAPEYGWDDF